MEMPSRAERSRPEGSRSPGPNSPEKIIARMNQATFSLALAVVKGGSRLSTRPNVSSALITLRPHHLPSHSPSAMATFALRSAHRGHTHVVPFERKNYSLYYYPCVTEREVVGLVLATADPKEIIRSAVSDGCAALDERQAKAVLAAYGVAVPEGGGARDENEAVAIARRVGFPVALKAVGPHISHKTERGLVVLGIQDEETVRTAAQSLLERAGDPDASLLVERMLHGARELMVGMKRDPLFGPVVVFGIGGVFTEALKDISLGVTPLAQRDVDQMLAGIRSAALLGSFRGMPPVDHAALTAVIRAVARIAEDHPAITEIDINPLIVDDATPVAAD